MESCYPLAFHLAAVLSRSKASDSGKSRSGRRCPRAFDRQILFSIRVIGEDLSGLKPIDPTVNVEFLSAVSELVSSAYPLGARLELFKLIRGDWEPVSAEEVFG